MRKSLEVLNVFNTLALKQIFWKAQTLSEKLEYRFLVKSAKIENATFPYKTPLPDPNFKTTRMGSKEWTYHQERSFAGNYFIFPKTLFQFKRTSYKELIWCANQPNVGIHTSPKRWSFIFWSLNLGCFFLVSILNSKEKQILKGILLRKRHWN